MTKKPEGKGEKGGDYPPGTYALRQIPAISGAIVALDPHTGRVLAMSGGYDYEMSEFNRATQAHRQPGSAFKPFVYLTALDHGFTPSTIILDAPFVIDQGPGLGKWKPANYEKQFYGPSPLRIGIEKSRNLMTVRLAQSVGMEPIVETAKRFGIVDDMPAQLSMALGCRRDHAAAADHAYAMLVNGGKRITPTLIDRVQDRNGKTVFRHDNRPCEGCNVKEWDDQPPPVIPDTREQVVDRGQRLSDRLHAAGRRAARHRADHQLARQAARRQDRHDERQPRHLVHRLLARPGRRRLCRLRPAEVARRA